MADSSTMTLALFDKVVAEEHRDLLKEAVREVLHGGSAWGPVGAKRKGPFAGRSRGPAVLGEALATTACKTPVPSAARAVQ